MRLERFNLCMNFIPHVISSSHRILSLGKQFLDGLNMILHRQGDPQGIANPARVVVGEVQAQQDTTLHASKN
jgi:hypothetical protein